MNSNKNKFSNFWNLRVSSFLFFKIILIFTCVLLGIITLPSKHIPITMLPKVAILYICTGKYIIFWDEFYKSMEKNFLPGYAKMYFVFTDDTTKKFLPNVTKIYQEQLPWPGVTLRRYHFFQKIIPQLRQYDYVYFLNANMRPLQPIGSEILPTPEQGLMVTKHPGFYGVKKTDLMPYDRNEKSHAYIPYGEGTYYFMGGFNGGRTLAFSQLINTIVCWTDADLERKIIPRWHDESYLNRYMIDYMKNYRPLILSERYGAAEGYNHIKDPMILILDKNKFGGHNYMRSK